MAVYTEVTDDDVSAFAASYGLGPITSFKGIAEGVENSNFFLAIGEQRYILTLYEKRVAPEDLPFFIGLVEHLAAAGFPCPVPVRDKAGDAIRELNGRPAALFTFLEGMWVRRPTASHCEKVGRTLAQLHLAGESYEGVRKNALGLGDWRGLFEKFAQDADRIAPGLGELIGGEIETLEAQWPSDLPTGVIHADLFPDNIFFMRDDVSGVIDFYFACVDALGFDIAVCLNAWCFEPDCSFNITKGRAFFRGYQDVRKISAREESALPILARGTALRFLLTRAYDWINTADDAFVNRKDPLEYARRLRFHQTIDSADGFGLDVLR